MGVWSLLPPCLRWWNSEQFTSADHASDYNARLLPSIERDSGVQYVPVSDLQWHQRLGRHERLPLWEMPMRRAALETRCNR